MRGWAVGGRVVSERDVMEGGVDMMGYLSTLGGVMLRVISSMYNHVSHARVMLS